MRNNILGGLVIFLVVVTCLLMIDDITNTEKDSTTYETLEQEQIDKNSDLAVTQIEE